MGLLSPWYLLGALALAVPLYVHLLWRHVTLTRPFTSVMFFERRPQSSRRQRRLRYFLLLALRLLLLLLLVLAFANPYLRRATLAGGSDKLVVLAIDDSFSMRAGTRLADAQQAALALLASNGGAQRTQVLALGSQVQLLTEPVRDPAALRRAVLGIAAGDSRGNFATLAAAVRSIATYVPGPIELHLFSDLQQSNLPPNFAEMALPNNVTLVLHPVVSEVAANWTVESVSAPAQVWQPKRTHVQAIIAGYGTTQAVRTVTLLVNGKPIATRPVLVPASGRASVDFESLDVPYGLNRCAVQIDSADTLAADDQFVFAVERSDPKPVLFVHQANDERSPLYFNAALVASAESAFVVEPVSVERAIGTDPARYAFVVLSDLAALPATFEANLQRFVQHGGSVWELLGVAAGRQAHVPLVPTRILTAHNYARESVHFASLGGADTSFPAFEHAEQLAGVKFYYATSVDPAGAQQLAWLADHTPLLLQQRVGEGRVLLLTTGVDNLTNDFPLQPTFVPFVEQVSRYLADAEIRSSARVVDALLTLRSAKEQGVQVELLDPAGQRPLSAREATSAQSFRLASAGFYQLRLASGRQDLIAVNADRHESDLALIPEDVLALWRGSATAGATVDAPPAIAAPSTESVKQQPLWWYALLLVLLAALTESALASRYLATPREAPET